jgi:hypothetical protein
MSKTLTRARGATTASTGEQEPRGQQTETERALENQDFQSEHQILGNTHLLNFNFTVALKKKRRSIHLRLSFRNS